MTKQNSYPYVLVSEFSRAAAKSLDDSRDEWYLLKLSDIEFGAIPMVDRFQVSDIENVDHEALLSDTKNLNMYYTQLIEETNKLQAYLGGMSGTGNTSKANVWGNTIDIQTYRVHRKAIVSLLAYKRLLQSKLKLAIHEHNRARAIVGIASGEVKRLASYHAGKDVEIINGLYSTLATCAKIYGFIIPDKFDAILEAAKNRVDYETHRYIERVGVERIDAFVERLDNNNASTSQVSKIVNAVMGMSKAQADLVLHCCERVSGKNE